MALFQSRFFSDSLGTCTSVEVLLPDRISKGDKIPTLYLLHGLSDDESIWCRRTSLERIAGAYRLAIVMPEGGRSFYSNLRSGQRFYDYVSSELPSIAESFFPLEQQRSGRFVAGLSMGGFGAFKIAFANPDRYSAVAGLSSVTDLLWLEKSHPAIWESLIPNTPENDLFQQAEKIAAMPREERPAIFQYCGCDDFLRSDNDRFRSHLTELGIAPHWEEGPGGHSWDNWDAQIRNVLAWLPLEENRAKTGAIGI